MEVCKVLLLLLLCQECFLIGTAVNLCSGKVLLGLALMIH